MNFTDLINAGKEFGLYGTAAVVLILLLVFAGRKAGLIATGNQARIANIVLSAILFGLSDNPQADEALMTAIGSIAAGLLYELLKWIGGQLEKGKTTRMPG